MIMKPFQVGDYIKEDGHGNEGTVEKIDLFYTYLLTPDNRTVSVPNGILSNTSLTNISRQEMRQIREIVGISYQADIREAKETIEKVLRMEKRILTTQDVEVFVETLGESSVDIGWRVGSEQRITFRSDASLPKRSNTHLMKRALKYPIGSLKWLYGRQRRSRQ